MSSSLRSATLTERKPPPIGVVIGPFSATPVSRTASRTSGGSGLPPCLSITSAPAWRTSQSNSTPVASSTRRVASVSSGPVPSPGIRVTRCATGGTLASAVWISSLHMAKKSVQLSGVSVAETGLSSIDAEQGVLMYRGYDIADLAEHATYEEVAYLLLDGDIPSDEQLDEFKGELAERKLPAGVNALIDANAREATPMEMLRTAVSA